MQRNKGALYLGSVEKELKRDIDYAVRMRRLSRIVVLLLAFSFVVFVVMAGMAIFKMGIQSFVSAIKSINLFYYSLALLVVFIAYVARFPKWSIYMKKLGINIGLKKDFMIYLSMYSMEMTPGRWGRAIVSYTINRLTNVKFARTFPAVVADIFTDFLGFVILLIGSALFMREYVIPSLVISAILILPFVFLYVRKPFEFVKRKFSKSKRFKRFIEVGELYFKSNKMLDRSAYLSSLGYTVPSMFLNGMSLYFVILAFGIPLPPGFISTVIFIYTTSVVLGMISGIPGALGVTDAAMLAALVGFLGGAGISFGIASLITIFFRIATLWFVELFSFAALSYTFKYWKQ